MNSKTVKIIMIIEAPPEDETLYTLNTVQAFNDAGIKVKNIQDIKKLGVSIITATKSLRKGYSVPVEVIKNDSFIVEKEIETFPDVQVFLLMGDTAIRSFNLICKRKIGKRIIPSGSTYKIRKQQFLYNNKRVFPSYLQTGKNYLIEKSKRKMIAEDIKNAFEIINLKKKPL
jgi:uracil-DNA glycosylase